MQELLLRVTKATKGFKKGMQFIGFERAIRPEHYIMLNIDDVEKTIPKRNCKVLARTTVKRII